MNSPSFHPAAAVRRGFDPFNATCVLQDDHEHRVRAVVDYVDVDLVLNRPTHPHRVISIFGPSAGYVSANLLSGGVAAELTVRIQNPASFNEVRRLIDQLSLQRLFARPPMFSRIEVSFDVYKPGATIAEFGEIAAKMYRHSSLKPSLNRRLATSGCKAEMPPLYPQLVEDMRSGRFSAYIGSQDSFGGRLPDPVSLRFYPKVTDAKSMLEQRQWRARMEVTLQGSAMPFRTMDEAARFRFESLARWFKFVRRLPDGELNNYVKAVSRLQLSLSHPTTKRRKPRGVYRSTIADPFGRVAYDALRSLSRRWIDRDLH